LACKGRNSSLVDTGKVSTENNGKHRTAVVVIFCGSYSEYDILYCLCCFALFLQSNSVAVTSNTHDDEFLFLYTSDQVMDGM
jgi:hypothetical protein